MSRPYSPPTPAQERNWQIIKILGGVILSVIAGWIFQYRQALRVRIGPTALDKRLASEDATAMLKNPTDLLILTLSGAVTLVVIVFSIALIVKAWNVLVEGEPV